MIWWIIGVVASGALGFLSGRFIRRRRRMTTLAIADKVVTDLRQQIAHRDRIVHIMHHELLDTAASVAGYGEALATLPEARWVEEQSEVREISNNLAETARWFDAVFASLFENYELSQEREPHSERIDLVQLLQTIANAFPDHQRIILLGQPTLHITTDSVFFGRIITNLIDNALKFSDATVTVTYMLHTTSLRVCICDLGIGIAPEQRQRVLAGGLRLHKSIPGTGMGLMLVQHLVTILGGTLTLATNPAGQGTCVTVNIPSER